MHSSRMHTVRCSGCVSWHACPCHTSPRHTCPPVMHAPATHAPLPHMSPCHTCPLPSHTHTLPHMPPLAIHALLATHALLPCMPHLPHMPLCHAHPPPVDRMIDACKNITFPQILLWILTTKCSLKKSSPQCFLQITIEFFNL